METTETALKEVLGYIRKNGSNGILAIPCFTRSLVIAPNQEDEMKKTQQLLGADIPFVLLYSGGEICPVYNKEGALVNRFHNLTYTLVAF